ncbi:MAG: hypothetical protein ACE5E8_09495, partial [Acidimicrobiia bacterium]
MLVEDIPHRLLHPAGCRPGGEADTNTHRSGIVWGQFGVGYSRHGQQVEQELFSAGTIRHAGHNTPRAAARNARRHRRYE